MEEKAAVNNKVFRPNFKDSLSRPQVSKFVPQVRRLKAKCCLLLLVLILGTLE